MVEAVKSEGELDSRERVNECRKKREGKCSREGKR